MSVRTEVMLWAQRILGRKGAPAHQLLEIAADASIEDAQNAFHRAARTLHPDLHRASLVAEDLELVTTAYARLAGAYQEFRSQRMTTTRMRPVPHQPKPGDRPAPGTVPPPVGPARTGAPSTPPPTTGAASAMTAKALIYYRKAEMCLRRGDLKGATLQLKMAIATDTQSAFLRTALAEVELELVKKP